MGYERKERDWSWYLGIVFAVFFFILFFQLIDDKFSYLRGGDTASYVLLAKALATGFGYSDINLPGIPPHTQYPPLFSVVLSPVVYLFGYNFMWMRLLVIGSALAALYFTYRYFSLRLPKSMAFALLFLTGTSYFVLTLSKEILPEIPYLFLTMLALYLYDKYLESATPGRLTKYLPLLAPLIYFTKSIGITFCFAVICVLLLRIKSEAEERAVYVKKLAGFLGLGVLPFIIWLARSSLYSKGVSTYQSILFQADYYDSSKGGAGLGVIFERAIDNITMYFTVLPSTFVPYTSLRKFIPEHLFTALLAAILILFLVGLIHDLLKKREIKDFYTVSFLSILMVWPTYGPGDAYRYLIPLTPLLYYYFFRGFELFLSIGRFFNRGESGVASESSTGLRGRAGLVLVVPVALLIILNFVQVSDKVFSPKALGKMVKSSSVLSENLLRRVDTIELDVATTELFIRYMPCYHKYLSSAKLLQFASGPDDIVMTRKPEVVFLLSGRRTVRFPYTSNEQALFTFMEKSGVTHILLEDCYNETKRYVIPVTEKYKEKFDIWTTAEGSHTGILKLKE